MTEKSYESEEYNPYAPPASAGADPEQFGQAAGTMPVTSVRYHVTLDDLREARRGLKVAVLLNREVKFVLFLISFIAVIVMLGVLANTLLPRSSPEMAQSPKPRRPVAAFVVAGASLGIVALFWNVRKRKGGQSPHEIAATIEPDGLRIREGDFHKSWCSWTRVSEIRETPTILLIVIQVFDPLRGRERASMAYPVPKRAFATPEAAASFLEAARRWHAEAIVSEASKQDAVKSVGAGDN